MSHVTRSAAQTFVHSDEDPSVLHSHFLVQMEVVGDSSEEAQEPRNRRGRQARVRADVRNGTPCMFLILAGISGFYSAAELPTFAAIGDAEVEALSVHGKIFLVGVVIGAWTLKNLDDLSWVGSEAIRGTRQHVFGLIEYVTSGNFAALQVPMEVDARRYAWEIVDSARQQVLDTGVSLDSWYGEQVFGRVATVTLVPFIALAVCKQLLTSFHAVPVTARSNRRLLLNVAPSSRVVKRFFHQDVPAGPAGNGRGRGRGVPNRIPRRPRWHNQIPIDLIIKWVSAVRFLRDSAKTKEATAAFAKVLTTSDQEAMRLYDSCNFVCQEVLRSARIRLDIVSMLLFRAYFKSLDLSTTHIHIWIDGSPQWRGVEMFAMSFDLIIGNRVERRLFPVLTLRVCQLDATSKTLALLWGIWLLVGPEAHHVRAFCRCVRSICTDAGVERLVVSMDDFIDEFIRKMNGKVREPLKSPELLFPKAVKSPGWRHCWDVLIRRGLVQLEWFPSWLKHLKAVVSWMREESTKLETADALDKKGYCGLACGCWGYSPSTHICVLYLKTYVFETTLADFGT